MKYCEKCEKKIMKRLTALILSCVMITSMSACGAEKRVENTSIRNVNIADINIGDIYTFGVYEQDNDETNGKENIEWIVLDKENGKVLLISKYALDCQPYNTIQADVTWETCTLRKWLNNDFINSAFSGEEKAMIPTVTVTADKNPSYSTSPGNDTTDKVFLLSITEANHYFSYDEARKCAPTGYAVAQGGFASDKDTVGGKPTCWWWLRSPGDRHDRAAVGDTGGSVLDYGFIVGNVIDAVRPALWIELESTDDAETKDTDTINTNTDDINIGDIYTFGAYEQDNDETNGKEDIEWIVLDKVNGKVLLISKYALDCKQYDNNTSSYGATWETCTLRKLLNDDFLNSSFSDVEKTMIPTVMVSADKNPSFSTDPGNATQDRVFLLSIPEAEKYFSSDEARKCAPTNYAVAQGVSANSDYTVGGKPTCCWWLRSPGGDERGAAYVNSIGVVRDIGCFASYDVYAVRPALWIDLNF